MSDQGCDERVINILEKLRKLKEDLESEKVPLDLLWISKNLTKNPEDYADKKALPHVQVALRLNSNAALAKKFRQGDVINYIICEVCQKTCILNLSLYCLLHEETYLECAISIFFNDILFLYRKTTT